MPADRGAARGDVTATSELAEGHLHVLLLAAPLDRDRDLLARLQLGEDGTERLSRRGLVAFDRRDAVTRLDPGRRRAPARRPLHDPYTGRLPGRADDRRHPDAEGGPSRVGD